MNHLYGDIMFQAEIDHVVTHDSTAVIDIIMARVAKSDAAIAIYDQVSFYYGVG